MAGTRRVTKVALLSVIVTVLTAVVGQAPAARADEPAARPKLYVVSDSVVLGARGAIEQAFADHDVTVDGVPAIFTEVAAQLAWERRDRIGKVAIVATGYNYPYWDPARFDRSIDTMVQRLTDAGAERIIWVTLREKIVAPNNSQTRAQIRRYAWYFPKVNAHLRRALDRHATLELADWAAISGVGGLTYDAIHLTGRGTTVMADLLRRTVDEGAERVNARTAQRLAVSVPVGARAMVWLDVMAPLRSGSVTVDDCAGGPGRRVDLVMGQTRRAMVDVTVGEGQQLCATADVAARLSLTEVGAAGAIAEPIALGSGPVRAGVTTPIAAAHQAGTRLVEVAVGLVSAGGPVTVWPCSAAPPGVSQLAAVPGETVSSIVAIDAASDVCVRAGVNAVVKVSDRGVIDGALGGAARRIADTRAGAPVPDHDVGLVTVAGGDHVRLLHLTVIGGAQPSTLVVGVCGTEVGRWRIEVPAGVVISRSLMAAGAPVCVSASSPVHVVLDEDGALVGW